MSNSPIHRVLYRALVRVARRHDVEPELKALLPAKPFKWAQWLAGLGPARPLPQKL